MGSPVKLSIGYTRVGGLRRLFTMTRYFLDTYTRRTAPLARWSSSQKFMYNVVVNSPKGRSPVELSVVKGPEMWTVRLRNGLVRIRMFPIPSPRPHLVVRTAGLTREGASHRTYGYRLIQ